jgi:hypothetical protein
MECLRKYGRGLHQHLIKEWMAQEKQWRKAEKQQLAAVLFISVVVAISK